MDSKIIITDIADNDLNEIYTYSYHNFGEKQADLYRKGLTSCLLLIADNPEIGKKFDDIEFDYRTYIYKSHTIIYRAEKTNIKIIRVLHNNSDTNKHL